MRHWRWSIVWVLAACFVMTGQFTPPVQPSSGNATSINGAAVPANLGTVATNASGQLINGFPLGPAVMTHYGAGTRVATSDGSGGFPGGGELAIFDSTGTLSDGGTTLPSNDGIVRWAFNGFSTSYTVGVGASNIPQFDSKSLLPAGGVLSRGTTFTASGCSVSSLVGGATAGSFASGVTGTCTVTITMGGSAAAPNGWACKANDLSTPADSIPQTTTAVGTATFSGTTVSGDVINFFCVGY